MNKITTGLFALAATAALAGNAQAQIVPNFTPFSIEARGGVALPQGDAAEDLETGLTFGGSLTYNFMPAVGAYVGYTRSSFGIKDVDDVKTVDQGFDAGLRLSIPTPLIPIDPFVKAGLVYHQLEFDAEGGNFSSDSELGFEVGAGVGFNILPKLQLTPAVTYSQFKLEAEDPDGGEDFSADFKNLRLDIGLRLRI